MEFRIDSVQELCESEESTRYLRLLELCMIKTHQMSLHKITFNNPRPWAMGFKASTLIKIARYTLCELDKYG